jgi:hypothetical protein
LYYALNEGDSEKVVSIHRYDVGAIRRYEMDAIHRNGMVARIQHDVDVCHVVPI